MCNFWSPNFVPRVSKQIAHLTTSKFKVKSVTQEKSVATFENREQMFLFIRLLQSKLELTKLGLRKTQIFCCHIVTCVKQIKKYESKDWSVRVILVEMTVLWLGRIEPYTLMALAWNLSGPCVEEREVETSTLIILAFMFNLIRSCCYLFGPQIQPIVVSLLIIGIYVLSFSESYHTKETLMDTWVPRRNAL